MATETNRGKPLTISNIKVNKYAMALELAAQISARCASIKEVREVLAQTQKVLKTNPRLEAL